MGYPIFRQTRDGLWQFLLDSYQCLSMSGFHVWFQVRTEADWCIPGPTVPEMSGHDMKRNFAPKNPVSDVMIGELVLIWSTSMENVVNSHEHDPSCHDNFITCFGLRNMFVGILMENCYFYAHHFETMLSSLLLFKNTILVWHSAFCGVHPGVCRTNTFLFVGLILLHCLFCCFRNLCCCFSSISSGMFSFSKKETTISNGYHSGCVSSWKNHLYMDDGWGCPHGLETSLWKLKKAASPVLRITQPWNMGISLAYIYILLYYIILYYIILYYIILYYITVYYIILCYVILYYIIILYYYIISYTIILIKYNIYI